MTQRSVRSGTSLCLRPLPESQPVLPALLRRLLQAGAVRDAHLLAAMHASGQHFARSLEWLLFTSLELDADQQRLAPQLRRAA